MRFCEQLNEYITRLDCRGKELAEAAGLSAPSLSRYRTGERTPGRGSAVLTALSDACLLYTSPRPRDISGYRMPSSA